MAGNDYFFSFRLYFKIFKLSIKLFTLFLNACDTNNIHRIKNSLEKILEIFLLCRQSTALSQSKKVREHCPNGLDC